MKRLALLSIFLLMLPSVVLAEDEPSDDEKDRKGKGSQATPLIGMPGTIGLTGMKDMIDGRTPENLSLRGGARYALLVRDRDFRGAVNGTIKAKRHRLDLYAGASLLGLVDVSARMPYLWDDFDINLKGQPDSNKDFDRGWGDFDLAAKLTIKLGPVSLAPYVHGRFPTGEPAVKDLAAFEYGGAVTLSLLNEYLSVHGNLAGLSVEEGLQALRYRIGAAFVFWADNLLLARAYIYADGVEFEGRANSNIDLELGLQVILFKFLTVEAGFSVRLVDAQLIENTLKRQLRQQQNVGFERHIDDDGTYDFQLGVGVVF